MTPLGERTFYRRPQRPDPDIVVVPTPDPPPPEAAASHAERDSALGDGTRGTSSVLGRGSRMTGKLAYQGAGRVDGEVDGELSADGMLIIGETAVVTARVEAASILVAGRVTGDITARDRLELRAPAKVFGNITTPKLVVQAGVVFEGQCSMGGRGPGAEHAGPVPPKDKRSAGS